TARRQHDPRRRGAADQLLIDPHGEEAQKSVVSNHESRAAATGAFILKTLAAQAPQDEERARLRLHTLRRHAPPPGLAFGEPDDRLRRGIQYAAASRLNHRGLWNTGSPASRAMTVEMTNSSRRRFALERLSQHLGVELDHLHHGLHCALGAGLVGIGEIIE